MTLDMAETLGEIFTEALMEVVAKVAGIGAEVVSADRDAALDSRAAFIRMNGAHGGMLLLSAEDDGIRGLCSYMEGIPESEVTREDMDDVLCELANMTAGIAELRLSGTEYRFTLSSPFVITGEGMTVTTKKRTEVISRTLGGEHMLIKLKVII